MLGTAIVRDKATEIVDVAYFVPELHGERRRIERRRLLLVEPSDFLRAMLAPVLQAAGFHVQTVSSATEAEAALAGSPFAVVVANIEDEKVFGITAVTTPGTVCIGLASRATPQPGTRAPGGLRRHRGSLRSRGAHGEHRRALRGRPGRSRMSVDRRAEEPREREDSTQLVTVFVGGQMFGLSILQVRDVFLVNGVTPVPLAPPPWPGSTTFVAG